jgi:hypothetical protein
VIVEETKEQGFRKTYSARPGMPRFPMSETRMFPDRGEPVGLSQGFVFFQQKRFAFRRTAVLHITRDGETADAADPRPSSYR